MCLSVSRVQITKTRAGPKTYHTQQRSLPTQAVLEVYLVLTGSKLVALCQLLLCFRHQNYVFIFKLCGILKISHALTQMTTRGRLAM